MSEVPQFVIKTLLLSFSVKKFSEYKAKFRLLFQGIDPIYDELFAQFEDFYKAYDTVITSEILLEELELAGHSKEAQYFQTLMADPLVAIYEGEAEFFNALEQAETEKTLNELFKANQTLQLELSQRKQLGLVGISTPIETFLTTAHALKNRSSRSESSTSSYLYQDEVQGQGTSLREIYEEIKAKADSGNAIYFNCGLKAFDDALFKDGDLIFYGGYTSHGKDLSLSTRIPTPYGWSTMGDLKVGDTIFSETGEQCKVIAATEIMYGRPCYRITFSNGSSIIASDSHQWFTWTARDRLNDKRQTGGWRANRRKNRVRRGVGKRPDLVLRNQSQVFEEKVLGSVKTTKDIMDTLLSGVDGRLNHSIPVCGSLQCAHVDLPIDPYLLGAWLGDGSSRAAMITIAEPDMVTLVEEAASLHGWSVTSHKDPLGFGIVGGMTRELKILGFLESGCKSKGIPPLYMRSSIEQRLALLQGLMDTDGFVSKIGDCEFVSIYKTLAEGVAELIRSLGGKVNIKESDAKLYGRVTGKKYRLIFNPEFEVFRLPRKALILSEAIGRKTGHMVSKSKWYYIQSVEPIVSVPTRCIEVDSPSKLFLCGDGMIPTHNSVLLRHNAYRQLTHYGRNVAFFTKEMTHSNYRIYFTMLHANNKERFPGTPYVNTKSFLTGVLTPEEEDFVFNYADRDLRCNENYGTLYLDQPNKSRYRLSDLAAQLDEIEATMMPVECLCYDYLMLMYPVESDKITPQRQDYNEMVKEFKNLLMTHRNIQGHITPLLGFTAAKISRGALKECEKNNGLYELSAFSDYSEIEFSADHVFTIYMTTEMKNIHQIRIQHHKNRSGPVIMEPYDAFINLEQGLSVHETEEHSGQEVRQILTGLQLG